MSGEISTEMGATLLVRRETTFYHLRHAVGWVIDGLRDICGSAAALVLGGGRLAWRIVLGVWDMVRRFWDMVRRFRDRVRHTLLRSWYMIRDWRRWLRPFIRFAHAYFWFPILLLSLFCAGRACYDLLRPWVLGIYTIYSLSLLGACLLYGLAYCCEFVLRRFVHYVDDVIGRLPIDDSIFYRHLPMIWTGLLGFVCSVGPGFSATIAGMVTPYTADSLDMFMFLGISLILLTFTQWTQDRLGLGQTSISLAVAIMFRHLDIVTVWKVFILSSVPYVKLVVDPIADMVLEWAYSDIPV